MEFTSLFDEASRDVEAESLDRSHVAAVQDATTQCWPFLALAKSASEYGHRLALVEDRLISIASAHGVSYEDITAPLEQGFQAVLASRQQEAGPDPKVTEGIQTEAVEHEGFWQALVGLIPRIAPMLEGAGAAGAAEGAGAAGAAEGAGAAGAAEGGGAGGGLTNLLGPGGMNPLSNPVTDKVKEFSDKAEAFGDKRQAEGEMAFAPGAEEGLRQQQIAQQGSLQADAAVGGFKCANCGHENTPHAKGGLCECGCNSFKARTRTAKTASDDATTRYQCPDCGPIGGTGWTYGLNDGLKKCQTCDGHGAVYRVRRDDSTGSYHRGDFNFYPAAKTGSKTAAYDEHIATLHRALMDGQDPLAWIPQTAPTPAAAEKPGGHESTQVFEGQEGSAYEEAVGAQAPAAKTGSNKGAPCYHPRSCPKCDKAGNACGAHKVGDQGHENCSGRKYAAREPDPFA